VVLVTRYSNLPGESHGTFAGDVNAFTSVDVELRIPVLTIRLEALEEFGILDWAGLEAVDRVTVTADVDLFAPGDSGYLLARIPGRDPSRAVILGAHIDFPNSPGALDDGSGAVTVLEVARLLDEARIVPPVDLDLVWFGSHERGLYGSFNFTGRNSELLDRSIAMLQMDCLGHPLDGIASTIWLETWSSDVFGNDRLLWPGYLAELDALEGWVLDGGLLVLTNTDRRLKYLNLAYDGNEDWPDVNALAQRFGVRYLSGTIPATTATAIGSHPLIQGVATIRMVEGNGHRFTVESGQVLAVVGSSPAAAIAPHGAGEVLVLADLGMLGASEDPPANRHFWANLAAYAR
jgi:hypothetical protein